MPLPILGNFSKKVYAGPTFKISKNEFVKPTNMDDVQLNLDEFDRQAVSDIPMDYFNFIFFEQSIKCFIIEVAYKNVKLTK